MTHEEGLKEAQKQAHADWRALRDLAAAAHPKRDVNVASTCVCGARGSSGESPACRALDRLRRVGPDLHPATSHEYERALEIIGQLRDERRSLIEQRKGAEDRIALTVTELQEGIVDSFEQGWGDMGDISARDLASWLEGDVEAVTSHLHSGSYPGACDDPDLCDCGGMYFLISRVIVDIGIIGHILGIGVWGNAAAYVGAIDERRNEK